MYIIRNAQRVFTLKYVLRGQPWPLFRLFSVFSIKLLLCKFASRITKTDNFKKPFQFIKLPSRRPRSMRKRKAPELKPSRNSTLSSASWHRSSSERWRSVKGKTHSCNFFYFLLIWFHFWHDLINID